MLDMATADPPPPNLDLSTPRIPSSAAVLTIYAHTKIEAPASKILSTLLDTSTWSSWNTFAPHVNISSQPSSPNDTTDHFLRKDTHFTMEVIMDPSKPTKFYHTALVVTDLQDTAPVKTVSWAIDAAATGLMSYGLRTERLHEIREVGNGTCEVRTWECQAGPLAYTVKWMFARRLNEAFGEWLAGLKKYVEGEEQGRGK